jgi:(p)ppGpp synthase/HD superfamily hydrolase
MAASLSRAAVSMAMAPTGIYRLARAYALAMEARAPRLPDEHHPSYLHPGRTVLVLLRDVSLADPVVLCAAALVESEDPTLRAPADRVRLEMGEAIGDLIETVPLPRGERLAEELVIAPEPVRLVALAERLDILRHAHMLDATPAWRRAVHSEARAVYLPVAERTHARLAERYRHWCTAFARRLERE